MNLTIFLYPTLHLLMISKKGRTLGKKFLLLSQAQTNNGYDFSSKRCSKFKRKFGPFNQWLGKELDSNGKLDRTIIFVGDKMFGADLNKLLAEDFGITDFREFFEGEHKGN